MDFMLCDTLESKAVDFKKVQPKSMGLMNKLLSEVVQPMLSNVTDSDYSGLI